MPDYLEESLDNVEQLLEQVRRSEQRAPVSERAKDGSAEPGRDIPADNWENMDVPQKSEAVYNKSGIVDYKEEIVDNRNILEKIRENTPKKNVNQGDKMGGELESPPVHLEEERARIEDGGRTAEGEQGAELAARLKQLDAAALASREAIRVVLAREKGQGEGLLPVSRFPAAESKAAGAAEESWAAGSGLSGTYPGPGGEIRWVEQADRAFRRDSRRYDGGFYLY